MASAEGRSKNHLNIPHVARYLVNKSLSLSTKKTYSNAFKLFNRFLGVNYGSTFANSIPVNVSCIMAFITYMFSLAYAPSSIITYVSAISFVHKVGNWPDPANNFIVQKMLIGIQKNCGTVDTRRPILPPLLKKLVLSVKSVVSHSYDQKLFQAMFLLAFHAFLRIGEITFSPSSPDNILKISDVKIRRQTVEISLRNYKHSHGQGPKRLILKKQSDKSLCPVTSLKGH